MVVGRESCGLSAFQLPGRCMAPPRTALVSAYHPITPTLNPDWPLLGWNVRSPKIFLFSDDLWHMTVIGVVGQFKFCLMFILVHKFRSFLFSEENIPLTNLVTSKRMKAVKFRILLPTLLISVNKVSDNATWKWGVCRRRRESLNMKSWKVDNFRYENFWNSWIP